MRNIKSVHTANSRRSTQIKGGFLNGLWRLCCQKFTIILIPHSEKSTIKFQISLLAIVFIALAFLGFLTGFFWLSLDFSGKDAMLVNRSRVLADTESSLNLMRDEVGMLMTSSRDFLDSLNETMDSLDLNNENDNSSDSGAGDLASLFDVQQSDVNTMAELNDLRNLRASLDNTVSSLGDMNLSLASQKELLFDIPTIWPLGNVKGWVTQVFGPSIHPFNKHWYLHRGLDLAFGYGVPILATADGKVVKRDFDANGFGLYIDIQHKYGFKTRYAHLQQWQVELGQHVSQGDVIGTMGNTGMSTGRHLHYEVMIGTQLVDPIKFLNMNNQDTSAQNFTSNLKRYQ